MFHAKPEPNTGPPVSSDTAEIIRIVEAIKSELRCGIWLVAVFPFNNDAHFTVAQRWKIRWSQHATIFSAGNLIEKNCVGNVFPFQKLLLRMFEATQIAFVPYVQAETE